MPEFSAVLRKYELLEELMKEQVKGMIIGVRNYKHDYLVHNDKIVYKDQDGISDKISYGFKTIYAHMHEHFNKKQISETSMGNAL